MQVASFYGFARLAREELEPLRQGLLDLGQAEGVLGTVLLAEEGINGSLCGPEAGVERVLHQLQADPRLAQLAIRRSTAPTAPFYRLKVRLKREIVSLGVEGVDPLAGVGSYVAPAEWNALINDPNTLVVDTRNTYEVEIGSFAGAIHPDTSHFREFPRWVEEVLPQVMAERQCERLALFCTGGIRCEKATAYLLQQGFEGVHHLQGGILGYLEAIPEEQSLWHGECFVFDERVGVDRHLAAGVALLRFDELTVGVDDAFLRQMAKHAERVALGDASGGCVTATLVTDHAAYGGHHRVVFPEPHAADVLAYPTWVMGNERRVGVLTLQELAVWTQFQGAGRFSDAKPGL
jgi:UPF0176 protein